MLFRRFSSIFFIMEKSERFFREEKKIKQQKNVEIHLKLL